MIRLSFAICHVAETLGYLNVKLDAKNGDPRGVQGDYVESARMAKQLSLRI
jgi:hypothetical protein